MERLLTRDQLLYGSGGRKRTGKPRSVVKRLRPKLGDDADNPARLHRASSGLPDGGGETPGHEDTASR